MRPRRRRFPVLGQRRLEDCQGKQEVDRLEDFSPEHRQRLIAELAELEPELRRAATFPPQRSLIG
jgi:hypothetical protein